jgi:hypothetical protein
MEALYIEILKYILRTEPYLPAEDAQKKAAWIFRFTTNERN